MGMKQLRIIGKSNYNKKMKLILIPTTQHGSDFLSGFLLVLLELESRTLNH